MPERTRHPVARLAGAVLYGQREEDAAARRKLRRILGGGSALGLVFWLLTEMWAFTKDGVRAERKEHAEQEAALVMALHEQTGALRELTGQMRQQEEANATFRAVMLERSSPPRPRPVVVQPVGK